jgi:hypothetical protein
VSDIGNQCDEQKPACYQCSSSGRNCPGPLQGTLFIDMSETIRSNKDRLRAKDAQQHKPRPLPYGSVENIANVSPTSSFKLHKLECNASRLPTSYQPDRQGFFQELYVAHFISSQDSVVSGWITELPRLLLQPEDQTQLYAIRATTMALYGRISRNKGLEEEATKQYCKGLECQQQQLLMPTGEYDNNQYISGALCSAIMFSYFESIICTTPMAWMLHYLAAGKMLEIATPEKCQSGLMLMFFRSIRVASVCSLRYAHITGIAQAKRNSL